MSAAPQTIRHVLIRGRVQRVGYRAWVEYTALEQGLEGWVRNRRDGAVEAVFAGSPETVAEMVEVCRQGPPGAPASVPPHARARAGGPERAAEMTAPAGEERQKSALREEIRRAVAHRRDRPGEPPCAGIQ